MTDATCAAQEQRQNEDQAEDGCTLREAMAASGLAAYCWTLATDHIMWCGNAEAVLETGLDAIRDGRSYASLLNVAGNTNRYDAVMAGGPDTGEGVSFQMEYGFRPGGRSGGRCLWLEDHGRWHAGQDGKPGRVIGTVRRIDARRALQQQLNYLGVCDPLTGLMNRLRLVEALEVAVAAAVTEPSSCALLIAVIANLPMVNETYGYQVADEVVAEVGRRLARVTRTGDAVGRYSGSKFGLIVNHCNEDDLAAAAERFLAATRERVVETEAGPVWAQLSIGAVILPRHGGDAATAIARAEEALAQARKQPSDSVAIYQPSAHRFAERSRNARCASLLVQCLKEKRLRLAFQPVIDVRSGRTAFHEALLRLADPAGDQIPASLLVQVAEKLGLVRLVDKAVTELAMEALARHPEARMSLNISGTTATDPRWFPEIIAILAAHRHLAPRLIVEITETVALGDLTDTTRFVQQLRELGAVVAIDDFGAGYTSFRNIRAMPVEMLKIDGAFCRGLAENPDHGYFVRSLIDMARAFGLRTVAEWVETEADANLLTEWGIDMMQGNLFGEAELLPPWPNAAEGCDAAEEPPPATDTLARFAADLEGELAQLRQAVSLLDTAFRTPRQSMR